jgi:hypothetical protein
MSTSETMTRSFFEELEQVTVRGLAAFRRAGFISEEESA